MMFSVADPNVNIVWIENVKAKIKALRDIEEGPSFLLLCDLIHVKIVYNLPLVKIDQVCLALQGKNCGYVTLMPAWTLRLDRESCVKGLVSIATASDACRRININILFKGMYSS